MASSGAIKAIIFDADGTLYEVHAESAYERLFACLAEASGTDSKTVSSVWRGHISNILNSRDARSAEKRKREYSIGIVLGQLEIIDAKKVSEITERALRIFWKQVLSDLKYNREAVSLAAALGARVPLAVASDEYRKNLEMKLNHIFGDWKKYFRFIVSADDTGELKPSEKYAELSSKRLGISAESILFVGDSWERDLAPAKLSGMRTFLVRETKEGRPDFWAKDIVAAEKQILGLLG